MWADVAATSIPSIDAPNLPYLHMMSDGQGWTKPHIPDIVADASVEQDRILWHDADGLTQALLSNFSDILSINQNSSFTLTQIIKAIEQAQDRWFSGARFTN